jgi:dTDP-4-amino-4,6-dideoxygalactose transaminase
LSSIEVLEGNSYSKPFRHLFVIKIRSNRITRNQLIERLREKGIICSVHFIPIYKFSYYKNLGVKKNELPITETAFEQCISLPFSSSISLNEAKKVVVELKDILSEN